MSSWLSYLSFELLYCFQSLFCLRFQIEQFKVSDVNTFQCLVSIGEYCVVEIVPGKVCMSTDQECSRRKDAVGRDWDVKKIFFNILSVNVANAHWNLGPGLWNTLCWVVNYQVTNLKIFVNNEIVRDSPQEMLRYSPINEMFFMNTKQLGHSFHGAMTDVQVWNRVLTPSQLTAWAQCEAGGSGDLISWDTAVINVTGASRLTADKEEICRRKENNNNIVAFNRKSSFSQSVKLCHTVGEVASVMEETEEEDMTSAVLGLTSPVCSQEVIPAGLVYSQERQAWTEFTTDREVAVDNWYDGRPSNDTNTNDCLYLILYKRQFYDLPCGPRYSETCPVCRITKVIEKY